MPGNVPSNTSGQPNYELNLQTPQETTSTSRGQKIEDKTTKGYEAEDIQKYGINRPIREIIYTKIVKQELPKTCITSEETKTTE